MKKKDFKEVYMTSFPDPATWCEWFFSHIDDENIFVIKDGCGKATSIALLQPYTFLYAGREIPSGYISCVATRPEARSHGYASTIMHTVISEARARGYVVCELIPAEENLCLFYKRFSFAPVFFYDRERYTALHKFDATDGVGYSIPSYDILHRLEEKMGCGVIHSASDFEAVIKDLSFESGKEAICAVGPDGSCACLFATYDAEKKDSTVTVRCLLTDNEAIADSALSELRKRVGNRPITVRRPPLSGLSQYLQKGGMARILDVKSLLGFLAAAHPHIEMLIAVHDPDFEENNGVFAIHEGRCDISDDTRRPDLDVTVDVLASILFSSEKTGKIFSLPTRRAYMSLMLD